MQHLTAEALARLVDETPGPAEAAHLDGCAVCREELDALRRQTVALAGLAHVEPAAPPPAHWDVIVARLAAAAATDELAPRRRTGIAQAPWFRVAAAVTLYALGTATGLALRARTTSAGAGQPPASPASPAVAAAPTQPTTTTVAENTSAAVTSAARPEEPAATQPSEPSERRPDAGRLVANNDASSAGRLHRLPDASQASTPEEALRYVRAAEQSYAQAYARYAELAQPPQPEDFVTRIATLQSIVLTTQQALDRAPADPVINGYHLTAVAQRDAALRQAALRSNGRWF